MLKPSVSICNKQPHISMQNHLPFLQTVQYNMWSDLQKGTISRISKWAFFKEGYFVYASVYIQTWVFYSGGSAVAEKWK